MTHKKQPLTDPRAVKYRRELSDVNYRKKWGRVPDGIAMSGLNKNEIYYLIQMGLIESFVYKRADPAAKSGSRMINLESLTAYLDKRSAEAKAEVTK
jgi:hypothetical protein